MKKTSIRSFVILSILALAMPAAAEVNPIPCAVGNKWEYETVKVVRAALSMDGKPMTEFRNASAGGAVYEVVSSDDKASPVVYNYKETSDTWPTKGGEAYHESSELKITSEGGVVRIISTTSESTGDDTPDSQTYEPSLLYYLTKDAVEGKSWEVGTMREREITNEIIGRGAGRETVTVPAGTFKDCLKVIYSGDKITGSMDMWDKKFAVTGGRSRGIYWVADGVGVVKELEISTTTSETAGPEGKKVILEAASCTVSELKPGYVVKK